MSDFSEELEDIDDTLLEVDTKTGEVRRAEEIEPDANRALNIRGSVSLIKAYQQCPAQAYGRITRQTGTKTLALVNGIAVHEAIERFIMLDKDPQVAYDEVLKFEAERNEVTLSGAKADEAKKVGRECVGAAVILLTDTSRSATSLKQRLVENGLVEAGFKFERQGRLYVGKMDIVPFKTPERYNVGDWKTGKNPPTPYELSTDIQFTMYALGASSDPALKTYGLWPEHTVYVHLRGASQEFDPNGRRVAKNRTKKPLQYDFPSKRSKEFVEYQFVSTIEPEMQNMEDGRWSRREGKACSNCAFFNKKANDGVGRCEVEIPSDAQLKKEPQISLIGDSELTASKVSKLKPYNDKVDVTSKKSA